MVPVGIMARGETAVTPGTGKLPAEGTQARRFGKTRSAQSTALLEDYVEPVSYTHLDVYKRQPYIRATGL